MGKPPHQRHPLPPPVPTPTRLPVPPSTLTTAIPAGGGGQCGPPPPSPRRQGGVARCRRCRQRGAPSPPPPPACVRAFWDVLDARHEVLLRGAEHRAARQAEVDNVAAYLARLLELSISLSATERRLRSAAAAERRGATPADHEARVRADAAALVGLVSEQERLADTCPICYDLLGGDSPAAEVRPRIRCGHRFHAHCLAGWKESCHAGGRTPSCPLCRGPLTSPTATARA